MGGGRRFFGPINESSVKTMRGQKWHTHIHIHVRFLVHAPRNDVRESKPTDNGRACLCYLEHKYSITLIEFPFMFFKMA